LSDKVEGFQAEGKKGLNQFMKQPSINELLEAGSHFGHQSRRWNPKMAPYIFASREGTHIIDLEKTEKMLAEATDFLKEVASKGGTIIFLATKKQAAETIKQEAERSGAMYLNHRWVGGLLTNWESVQKTIHKLPDLEEKLKEAKEQGLTKREQVMIQKEIDKLTQFVGGIRKLKKKPDALFIVDSRKEDNAVREARKTEVPIVAIVDTNADPTKVDYPIPANDDAIKSISILVKAAADAVEEGLRVWEKKEAKEKAKAAKEEEKEGSEKAK